MSEELQQKIVDFIKGKTEKGKGLNSMRDIAKSMKDVAKKDVREAVSALIDSGKLKYWSSGSTTYVTMPDFEPGSGETEE